MVIGHAGCEAFGYTRAFLAFVVTNGRGLVIGLMLKFMIIYMIFMSKSMMIMLGLHALLD